MVGGNWQENKWCLTQKCEVKEDSKYKIFEKIAKL